MLSKSIFYRNPLTRKITYNSSQNTLCIAPSLFRRQFFVGKYDSAYMKGKYIAEINSVAGSIECLGQLKQKTGEMWDPEEKYHESAPPFNFPFGLWFRGHEDSSYELMPSAFREGEGESSQYQDETSMFRLFQSLKPEYSRNHTTTFEWLSLMQHYLTPTRLLDWSESILVSLYFIVSNEKKDDKDGILWILNATRLNSLTSLYEKKGIASPTRFDVVIRSEMSLVNDLDGLFRRNAVKKCDEIDSPKNDIALSDLETKLRDVSSPFRKKLSLPIAVYPRRLSDRLKAQSGVFTLFGGKRYYKREPDQQSDKLPSSRDTSRLPECQDFFSFSEDTEKSNQKNFLKAIKVPKESKPAIRKQLFELGIHQGSIFGELDYQSNFIKQQFTYRRGKP